MSSTGRIAPPARPQIGHRSDQYVSWKSRRSVVLECHLMAGDCDFLLRVVAADLEAYRRFQVDHLTRIKGVQRVKTEIPMQQIKQSTELPL